MKLLLTMFSLILLLTACGGDEPATDPAINIPGDEIHDVATPDLTAGIDLAQQNACRVNMQAASAQVTMYIAQHGVPPETLEEALSVSISCPEGGDYIYTVDGDSWKIECPAGHSHGYIEDGQSSW